VRRDTTGTDDHRVHQIQPLSADVVRAKLWKPLMQLKDDKQVFTREASLITIGRVASDDALKAEARKVLLEAIKDPNHLVARAAALGLYYVADETSMLPMFQVANDGKAESDVRAFLALTLTAMKSDMAGPLLTKLVSADKEADFELVSASILALGFVPGPESARYLKDVYENRKFRAEVRALAVESFGRRGSFDDWWEICSKALDDRETDIRRSAAMALGLLEYRTAAEREISALAAEYDQTGGAKLPADVQAKIDALKPLIAEQRAKIAAPVREIVKRLVHSLQNDNDAFVQSMAAISLGRICGQTDEEFARRMLLADLKKERHTVREYEILALAIAHAPEAFDVAKEAVIGKNSQPTTKSAGLIALGILGDPKGAELAKNAVEEEGNPLVRGYGTMALGMIGDDKTIGTVTSFLKTTKSPDAMMSAALGLALFGRKSASEILVKHLTDTDNADIASYNVYALGLTKDRSKIDSLIDTAVTNSSFYVQSAAVAAIGYLASAEDYPRRHLMARGYDYMLNLTLMESYFYKL